MEAQGLVAFETNNFTAIVMELRRLAPIMEAQGLMGYFFHYFFSIKKRFCFE
jgi:hypothetical protein